MSLKVDIRKDFGDFRLNAAFEAEDGITALLGASGSGKSLTLKCIAGIVKPDEGRIELDGRVLFDSTAHINLPPQKRKVGYLFQNGALFPDMTVRKNILCGLHRERNPRTRENRLNEIIKMMRLHGLEDHLPSQLSGGQAQRTALARILVNDPELLLLDEPFSALDGYLRDSLKIELRDMLCAFGKEVIMVTHSRDEAYNMSGKIGVMSGGRILAAKPTKELFEDPETVEAAKLTGCKNIVSAHRVSDFEVYVPAWKIGLRTAKRVRDDLAAIGIRAHDFDPDEPQNRYRVERKGEMEEPFEMILTFRYPEQSPESAPVWWRVGRDRYPKVIPREIGIAPEHVLLLCE